MKRKLNENIVPLRLEPLGNGGRCAPRDPSPFSAGDIDIDVFKEMVDNALHGIMVHDQHKPLYINGAWAALHGLTVNEVMVKPTIVDLIHESDRERLLKYRDDRLQGIPVPKRYRYRGLHADGRVIWLEHFVRVIDWQGQNVIMSTIVDVDDQERQVVALREQRQSMKQEVQERSKELIQSNRELYIHQSVVDQMGERISVVDTDYRFRMSNRANLEFRGLTRSQLVGRHLRETMDAAYFENEAKWRLDQAFKGMTHRSESLESKQDGKQAHVQVTTEPFRDTDGTISGAIVSVRDITAAKLAEEQLRLFASVIEQISDRISVIDLDYRFRLANKACANHYHALQSKMLGRHLTEIVGTELFESFSKPNFDRCFNGERLKIRHSFSDMHGKRQTIDALFEPYFDTSGEITGAVATVRDISEAQNMSDRLAYQARFDQLTGLLNRRAFEQLLEKSLKEVASGGRNDVLCFIDLDQFKIVNDTVGHLIGDELLKQVAKLLSSKLHEDDVLARFGGDEFALLLRRCSLRRAKRAAEQLISVLQEFEFFHNGLKFQIGASVGITAVHRHVASAGDVMAQADLACYAAKDNGRNQVQIFKKGDASIRRRQEEMYRAGSIKTALDEERFVLFGQPIVPTNAAFDVPPQYVEILLRMIGERSEIIKPSSFIPAAERYGMMAELDRWVIRNTLGELRRRDTVLDDKHVSINLSGVTLNDETSMDFIRQALSDSDLHPGRITFEITETAAIRNIAATQTFMNELRSWGCRFALDDFGSGLSSLQYLKRLPVDFLKIDGSFIRDIAKDHGSRAMVKAINQMAKDLGIMTVAEGVESQTNLETVSELGIDYAQGYVIGIPTALGR